MTFAQKGSIAIAVLILGWVLDAIGYQANQAMSEGTIDNMKIIKKGEGNQREGYESGNLIFVIVYL